MVQYIDAGRTSTITLGYSRQPVYAVMIDGYALVSTTSSISVSLSSTSTSASSSLSVSAATGSSTVAADNKGTLNTTHLGLGLGLGLGIPLVIVLGAVLFLLGKGMGHDQGARNQDPHQNVGIYNGEAKSSAPKSSAELSTFQYN